MSLINQMLKDLEQRRSQDKNSEGLIASVPRYAAANRRAFPWPVVFMVISLVLLLIVGYLLWERSRHSGTVDTVITETPQQADTPKPAFAVRQSEPLSAVAKPASKQKSAQQKTETLKPQPLPQPEPTIATRIKSVEPNPVEASTQQQAIDIMGSGFSKHTRITVGWTGKRKTLPSSQLTYLGSSHLRMHIVVGNNADSWTVEARDPVYGQSEKYVFEVVTAASEKKVTVNKVIKPLNRQQQSELNYQQGYQLLAKGQPQAGEQRLLEALHLYPKHLKAREILAGLYTKSGRVIEASDLLQQGLVVVPGHLPFAKLRARLLLEQNQLQQAIKVLEKHEPASLIPLDYHAFMAALYQRNKQHARAAEKYRQLLEARPTAGIWRIGLAISLEGLGQQPDAIRAYLRAKKSGNLTAELLRYADNRLSALQKSGFKLPQVTE